jgi:hypothetical protein
MRAICVVLLSILFTAGAALAQATDSPAALFAGADIVFDGRLEKIAPSPSGSVASFFVNRVIKGGAARATALHAQVPAESRCHGLEENHRYLVYGRKIGEQIWVDPCEGSKLFSQAEPDLRYIRTVVSSVSEQCNRSRLRQLARNTPIVATAKLVGTEDSMGTPSSLFRPWCGLVLTTEYAYYDVIDVLKGQIPDRKIAVEHAICWDTITIDGYSARLSPELFREGNVLLLFLKTGSHRDDQVPQPFKSGYEDVDENCGAVNADSDAVQSAVDALHTAK